MHGLPSGMFWWDWTGKQKLLLLATMVAIAAIPWLLLGSLPTKPGAFIGGTAFLMIPQLVGWLLLVGLKTGRIPMPYGSSESREGSPFAFWAVSAIYAVLVAYVLFITFMIGTDIVVNGLE